MDSWQIKRQLAFLVAAFAWADTPSAVVFTGGAVVSEDLEGNFAPGHITQDGPASLSLPFARVSCPGWEFDEEGQGRVERALFRVFATAGGWSPVIAGGSTSADGYDTHGVNQVSGKLRDATNGQGKSAGRDVDELLSRFAESLTPPGMTTPGQLVESTHAIQGRATRAEAMVPVDGVQVLKRALEIEVTNPTASRYYHAPTSVLAVAAGGGSVTISWTNPPTRFDTFKNVLRRGTSPGDAAPTSVTGGTGITLGSSLATSATDAGHTAGQHFNYAVFHTYTETTAAVAAVVADRASAGAPSNTVTVT